MSLKEGGGDGETEGRRQRAEGGGRILEKVHESSSMAAVFETERENGMAAITPPNSNKTGSERVGAVEGGGCG